jgi:hypothetical protein
LDGCHFLSRNGHFQRLTAPFPSDFGEQGAVHRTAFRVLRRPAKVGHLEGRALRTAGHGPFVFDDLNYNRYSEIKTVYLIFELRRERFAEDGEARSASDGRRR